MKTFSNYILEKLKLLSETDDIKNYLMSSNFENSYISNINIQDIKQDNKGIFNVYIKGYTRLYLLEKDILSLANISLISNDSSPIEINIWAIKNDRLDKRTIDWINTFIKNIKINSLNIQVTADTKNAFNLEGLNINCADDRFSTAVLHNGYSALSKFEFKNVNINRGGCKNIVIPIDNILSINGLKINNVGFDETTVFVINNDIFNEIINSYTEYDANDDAFNDKNPKKPVKMKIDLKKFSSVMPVFEKFKTSKKVNLIISKPTKSLNYSTAEINKTGIRTNVTFKK